MILAIDELTETEKAMQRDTSAMIDGLRISLMQYIDDQINKLKAELGLSAGNVYPANWPKEVE